MMTLFRNLSKLGIAFTVLCSVFFVGTQAYANSVLTSVHILQSVWRGDPSVPVELQNNSFDFIVMTQEHINGEDMVFIDHAGKTFQLTANGYPDLTATINGGFGVSGGTGFIFSIQNIRDMVDGVAYSFVAPQSEAPYEWHADGVTLTKPSGALSSGSNGNTVSGSHQSDKLARIEANEREMVLTSGQTRKIKIYSIDANGVEKDITRDKKTVYRTDSASIADVSSGVVKAGSKEGTANITVSYNGQKTTIRVQVTRNTMTQLISSDKELTLETEELQQINLTAVFSDGSIKDVTSLANWTTDNSEAADVESGEIAAIDPGSAVITAYYNGVSVSIQVEVEAAFWEDEDFNALVGLEASNKNIRMNTDEEKLLQIYALYEDGSREEVTDEVLWQTSKSDVVDVENGLLLSSKAGKAIVMATYKKVSLQITVTVEKEKPIKSLTASTKKVILQRGKEKELILTAIYADGTKGDVTEKADWTSRDESIAEVDAGVITAGRKGSTVITATYNGRLVNIIVKVK